MKHEHIKSFLVVSSPEKWYRLQRGPLHEEQVYEGKLLEMLGIQLSVNLLSFFSLTCAFRELLTTFSCWWCFCLMVAWFFLVCFFFSLLVAINLSDV